MTLKGGKRVKFLILSFITLLVAHLNHSVGLEWTEQAIPSHQPMCPEVKDVHQRTADPGQGCLSPIQCHSEDLEGSVTVNCQANGRTFRRTNQEKEMLKSPESKAKRGKEREEKQKGGREWIGGSNRELQF